MMRSTITDIEVRLHHSTDRAVLVRTSGDREDAVWLARSQIEIEPRPNGHALVTLEQWLAEEKGLV